MDSFIIPNHYHPLLGVLETEKAIKSLRVYFEEALSKQLNLMRISAPLFVHPETGLNDNLNDVERPVSFDLLEQKDVVCEIVHSLAKWKRHALGKYGFAPGTGLYTNMNAIRRDEYTDNLHSIYVDQWDWEKVISPDERNLDTLKAVVSLIYEAFKDTQRYINELYPKTKQSVLPDSITFVTTQEMEDRYPNLTPKQRELAYTKQYGAIFLMQIGGILNSGTCHDGRAADYDDWSLNGDILLDYPLLDTAMELSSMGIRVDKTALRNQLKIKKQEYKLEMPFQKSVLAETVPFTIGGGIGQSRLCMYMLGKAHIGEVQVSVWPPETEQRAKDNNILLL